MPTGTTLLLWLSKGISLEQILGTVERCCTIKKTGTSQAIDLTRREEERRLMIRDPRQKKANMVLHSSCIKIPYNHLFGDFSL